MYDFCYITFAALELSNAFLQQPCRLERSHGKQMVGCSIPSREDLSVISGFCTLKNPHRLMVMSAEYRSINEAIPR